VKAKVPSLMSVLEDYDLDRLLEFFEEEKWPNNRQGSTDM
jgi:hypothetical protein